jgi:hypothetical protein
MNQTKGTHLTTSCELGKRTNPMRREQQQNQEGNNLSTEEMFRTRHHVHKSQSISLSKFACGAEIIIAHRRGRDIHALNHGLIKEL